MFTLFDYILFIVFLGLAIYYIYFQFLTIKFESRFRLILGLLLGQSITGLFSAVQILQNKSSAAIVIAVIIIVWSVLALFVGIVKFIAFDEFRYRKPKDIARERVQVGLDHKKFHVMTSDNVKITGYHIKDNHRSAIIILHGGLRSKDSFAELSLAQWLSYDYDIIAFDARGHNESEGDWTGDGKTCLDLAAVMDYAKPFNYKKIGVIGRSLGGFTALLFAAENKNLIDSLVIISAPLTHIRVTKMVSQVEKLKSLPGRILVRAIVGLRYHDYNDNDIKPPLELLSQIKIPTFLIYAQKDDTLGITEDDVRAAYDQIKSPKKLYLFPGINHLPKSWHMGPIYLLCKDWFKDTLQE